MTGVADDGVAPELRALRERLDRDRAYHIGFPGAVDVDFTEVQPFFAYLLNNVGDPFVDGVWRAHTKHLEREVVTFVADLFAAPPTDRWGYVTSGGSEGNLYALHLARGLHPDAMVYLSEQAHYSLLKAVELLRLPCITIRAHETGAMDIVDLADQLDRYRHRAAVVVATAGTTMSEAVDDVRQVARTLDAVAIQRRFVHVDAALAGIPLALLDRRERPGLDFGDGADSITVSGHKFLGVPFPCGVVVTRASHRSRASGPVRYTGSPDATITGSRSGHAPLLLWYAIRRHGIDGLRVRAEAARELAAYAHRRLDQLGWAAYRHRHAFTVVLKTPPEAVATKWVLASAGGWSHIVTMPGVTRESVDAFLADLENAMASRLAPLGHLAP